MGVVEGRWESDRPKSHRKKSHRRKVTGTESHRKKVKTGCVGRGGDRGRGQEEPLCRQERRQKDSGADLARHRLEHTFKQEDGKLKVL